MTGESNDTGASVATSSGYTFVRSPGISKDAPIVCLETRAAHIPKAELEYLQELHQQQNGAKFAEVVSQSLIDHAGSMLDALTVRDEAGAESVVYFDVTRSELFLGRQSETPWYLPDAKGFVRDVKSGRVGLATLMQVLGTIAFIPICIAVVYLLFIK